MSTNSIRSLLAGAVSSGTLSAASAQLIDGNLGDIVIAGAAGKDLEEIEAADVTLVTVLLDKSSSIGMAGLEAAVRDGYGVLLDAFQSSRESDAIMVALWLFDHEPHVVHSYVPVDEATRLNASIYQSGGATALYDTWCDALTANVAYAQRLRDGGTPCRSIVVVITDGEDCGSKRRAGDCKRLSTDVLASEQFVLAFVGVGASADFRKVAKAMGVPKDAIAVQPQATAARLRQVFQLVSQSAIRASQAMVTPSQGAGFFSP